MDRYVFPQSVRQLVLQASVKTQLLFRIIILCTWIVHYVVATQQFLHTIRLKLVTTLLIILMNFC